VTKGLRVPLLSSGIPVVRWAFSQASREPAPVSLESEKRNPYLLATRLHGPKYSSAGPLRRILPLHSPIPRLHRLVVTRPAPTTLYPLPSTLCPLPLLPPMSAPTVVCELVERFDQHAATYRSPDTTRPGCGASSSTAVRGLGWVNGSNAGSGLKFLLGPGPTRGLQRGVRPKSFYFAIGSEPGSAETSYFASYAIRLEAHPTRVRPTVSTLP